jgi:AhpD family alkylhydroperoxidase
MENRIKLLIAVGASVTANCQPCLQHLMREAKDSGAEEKEIMEAIAIAKMVRKGAMAHMDEFASGLIGEAKPVAEDSENGCGCS